MYRSPAHMGRRLEKVDGRRSIRDNLDTDRRSTETGLDDVRADPAPAQVASSSSEQDTGGSSADRPQVITAPNASLSIPRLDPAASGPV